MGAFDPISQTAAAVRPDCSQNSAAVSAVLRTDRLVLRQPQASDLPACQAFYTSPRSKFVGGPYPLNPIFDKLAAMIGHWQIRGFGRYILTLNGRPIGHVGPLQQDDLKSPEMTWSLWDGACEGKGYMTEACQAVLAHLFDDLNWTRLNVLVLQENTASLRVAERLGAVLTDHAAPDWYPNAQVFELTKAARAT